MKITDILSSPWAIMPEKLLEIRGIYATHLRGEKIDIKGVEAAIGRPLANNRKPTFDMVDGVAIIPVEGVIAKRMSLFSAISGGVSTEQVGAMLSEAAADPAVHSIILAIDSPGGTVDGTQSLSRQIMDLRASGKPVVTLASGMMASAAYWIGSAAPRVFIADGTTIVGSIGVVATHTDVSQAEANDGYKTTEITAGKFKRIASQYAPLSAEGRSTIQEQVDYLYSIFVSDVAAQRGVSVETVLANMADGRLFTGQQAVDAGLVDGVSTLAGLIDMLNRERSAGVSALATTQKQIAAGATMEKTEAVQPLTLESVREKHPEIAKALTDEGFSAGVAAGAEAERKRIHDVEAQSMPGHETLISALKFDGKTTGAEAAVQVLAAEKGNRAKLARFALADSPSIPFVAIGIDPTDTADNSDAPVEERCKAKWDASADLRNEFTSYEAYLAYTRADESGRIKNRGSRKE